MCLDLESGVSTYAGIPKKYGIIQAEDEYLFILNEDEQVELLRLEAMQFLQVDLSPGGRSCERAMEGDLLVLCETYEYSETEPRKLYTMRVGEQDRPIMSGMIPSATAIYLMDGQILIANNDQALNESLGGTDGCTHILSAPLETLEWSIFLKIEY